FADIDSRFYGELGVEGKIVQSAQSSALNLPSSPFPLPIIGNLHLLDIRRQDKSLMKISEKPGPVFTFPLGFQKVVVLTGYKAVKDALLNTGDMFADRPPVPIFYHVQHGKGTTVFFSSQELWKTTRWFTIAAMSDLDMGKHLGEERMLEELRFLIELIKSIKGRPFQLWFLNMAPSNITFAILFGRRFDYEDPTFLTQLRLTDEVMHLLGSPSLYVSYPLCALPLRQTDFMPFLCLTEKVHRETEQVRGPSCLPTFEDRKKMPFTDAVIHLHQARLLLQPHMLKQRPHVPSSLATMELFIFFTGLVQKLIFKPLPGVKESELNTTAEAGFTMRLQPQCVCTVLRQ
uniref:Cytochrome P450 2W1 n=1 Tax=Amazona collaria TaxID=241587 RepID=A0A8B9FAN9_9PSIT